MESLSPPFFGCLGLLVAFLALDRWFRAWS